MTKAKGKDPERVIDHVEEATASFHAAGRAAMGVSGEDVTEPFWGTLRRHKLSLYTLTALGLLTIVDRFQGTAFFILGPEISRAIGLPRESIALLVSLAGLVFALASLPMAAFVERKPRRAFLAIVTGIGWSITTLFTGFVIAAWEMAVILLADGFTSASTGVVHSPLIVDSYPPSLRVRMLAAYRGFRVLAAIFSPLLVFLLVGPFELTWRGTFLVMGLICVTASLYSLRLRDPGFGRFDTARLREAVRKRERESTEDLEESEVKLRFPEIVRRLLLIPTARRVLAASAVLGMLLVPLNTYIVFFLEERWNLLPDQRALFFVGIASFGLLVVLVVGRRGEGLFRKDPRRLFILAAGLQATSVVLLGISILMPAFWLMFVLFGLASAVSVAQGPLFTTGLLSIVRPQMRPHAAVLVEIFEFGVGGILGALLLGGLDRRYGTGGAILAICIPGLLSALVLRSAGKFVNDDLDRCVDELIEEEELSAMRRRGARLPMLACRKVDFSYEKLQVLFDVDFTVDDGEMVALLGTNGAGKSTLLKVISGLCIPQAGSVRFRGADVTYLDPERRVPLGISQVPSDRSVFGPLSVHENLQVFGHLHGRDDAALKRGIDTSYEIFPRLHERRSQLASTLSGGERQMLGLARSLILRPRLLLVDELSLGLAPLIVTELLQMIRRINADGCAVVLVEQSVNVALSVVEHAYFMEKGEIRFDGKSSDLMRRPDLLRSVFLEGATKGMAADGFAPKRKR